jgi:hypothetical protein
VRLVYHRVPRDEDVADQESCERASIIV